MVNASSVLDPAALVKLMPHSEAIGMAVDPHAPEGRFRIRIPPRPDLAVDPAGRFYFPGVLFSLADSACGLAATMKIGRLEPMSTLDIRIDHLAPAALDSVLVADAECYCLTRSVAFSRCEIRAEPDGRLLASIVGTFMRSAFSAKKLESTSGGGAGSLG